jgi:ribonuclease-3
MKILKNIFNKNSRSTEDGIFFAAIQDIIGFKPQTIYYYQKAFTHRSTNRMDSKGNPMNYERLEFLGDVKLCNCSSFIQRSP